MTCAPAGRSVPDSEVAAVVSRAAYCTGDSQRSVSSIAQSTLRAVGAHRLHERGVAEQGEERVADQAVGGLGAGGEQQAQEAEDLLVAEPLALDLGVHQAADQIVARLGAPLLEQRAQEIDQLLRRLEALRRIVGEANDVEAPVVEGAVVLHRHADDLGDHLDREQEGELRNQVGASVGGKGVDQLADDGADDLRQVAA